MRAYFIKKKPSRKKWSSRENEKKVRTGKVAHQQQPIIRSSQRRQIHEEYTEKEKGAQTTGQ